MKNRGEEAKTGELMAKVTRTYRRFRFWIKKRVPYGIRTLLGVLLIIGGIFGFLPILGFWMIPLGIAVIWIDVSAARNWMAKRRR